MVPPASFGDARAPKYSGYRQPAQAFAYGALTLYGVPSQVLPLALADTLCGPTTPSQSPKTVWALPRSLAATRGVSFDFLSCGYLDVSVPRVGSACAVTAISRRVSPFGHLRIKACLPAPRSFSQAPTSFFASCCQGIHHVPLSALSPRHS